MRVESEEGAGSIFYVALALPLAPPQEARRAGPLSGVARVARVLVVDDTEMVRDVSMDMLLAIGCTVDTASSGEEALVQCAYGEFDLILMDCQMPNMDGLETTRRLLHLYPELSIVAMTAHTSARDQEQSLNAGMVAHLNKPFTLRGLETVIDEYARAKV